MNRFSRLGPDTLFLDIAQSPAEHFRIYFFGAVLGLIEHVSTCFGSFEEALKRFPFLAGYNNELAQRLDGLASDEALARWWASLDAWEQQVREHLPLRALREALELDHAAMMWLLTLGLVEEDTRFGAVFEAMQGTPGQRRPTCGLLRHCWGQYPRRGTRRTTDRAATAVEPRADFERRNAASGQAVADLPTPVGRSPHR